jgi:hypothetical protein
MCYAVDYPAWSEQGWSINPPVAEEQISEAPVEIPIVPGVSGANPYATRKAELEGLLSQSNGWRRIEAIASPYGVSEKPAGGWADAIPLILEAEGLKPIE